MNVSAIMKLQALLRQLSSGKGWHSVGKKVRAGSRMKPEVGGRYRSVKAKGDATPEALTPEEKEFLKKTASDARREARGEAFARGTARRRAVDQGKVKDRFGDDGGYSFLKQPVAGALYQLGRRPLVSAVGAAASLPTAYQMVGEPLGRGYAEEVGLVGPRGEAAQRAFGERAEQAQGAMEMRQRRLERQKAENLARLAQVDPHAYMEMATGERLAPGTQVFGGRPRQDILDMVAGRLGEGSYPMM